MNTLPVEKFIELERQISQKKGDFALFALFAREDLPDRWDLVFSAAWPKSSDEAIAYVVSAIRRYLGAEQLTNMSLVVFVAPTDPPVLEINRAFQIEHGSAEVRDANFFGMPMKHAYIITSRFLQPAASK